MLKILQARLQQYMNREHSDIQTGFRKGRETRDQIANICWIIEKAREFQKNVYFVSLKPLTVWITTNCGKLLINRNTKPSYLPPAKPVCRSKRQQLKSDMELSVSTGIIWFLFLNFLVWCITLIDLHILKNLCIPAIQPT